MIKTVTSVCFSLIVLMFSPFANAESVLSAETFLLARTVRYGNTIASNFAPASIIQKTTKNSCSGNCLTCDGSKCLTCVSGYKLTYDDQCLLCPNGCHITTNFSGGDETAVTTSVRCVKDSNESENCHTTCASPCSWAKDKNYGVCARTDPHSGLSRKIACNTPCPVGCKWKDDKSKCVKTSDTSKNCY